MPRTFFACAALAVVLSLPSGGSAHAQAVPGTIVGAEAVNVRRGPGTDSPAFIAVRRDARVLVDERSGQWARVTLESGESGYINVAYIALAADTVIPTAGATPAAGAVTPLAAGEATATLGAEAAAPLTPALDRELADLRERMAALEASLEHGATPAAPPAGSEPIAPLPPLIEPPAALDVGPMLALAGVGFLAGFLAGTFYGQRQERNRRTRVRF